MRARIRTSSEAERPQSSEPTVKTMTPSWNTFTLPRTSPRRPNGNIATQVASRYTELTSWMRSRPTPSSFCITGSATVTTVESRHTINVMMSTVNRIAHLFLPWVSPSRARCSRRSCSAVFSISILSSGPTQKNGAPIACEQPRLGSRLRNRNERSPKLSASIGALHER